MKATTLVRALLALPWCAPVLGFVLPGNKQIHHTTQVHAAAATVPTICSYTVMAFSPSVQHSSQVQHQSSLRTVTSMSNSSNAPSGSDAATTMYNREHEQELLHALLCQKPAASTVLLGPRNCGKTALLKHYTAQHEDAPVCYMDCRQAVVSSPAALTKALADVALRVVTEKLKEDVRVKPRVLALLAACVKALSPVTLNFTENGGDVLTDLILSVITEPGKMIDMIMNTLHSRTSRHTAVNSDMVQILQTLYELIRIMHRPTERKPYPVLILDEANLLMDWTGTFDTELTILLNCLVALCKQDQLCHIILATSSETGFQDWLKKSK